MAKALFRLLLVYLFCNQVALYGAEPQNIPVEQLGKAYRLVGKLQVPLGDVVRVEGVVVDGPYKGYEDGPNLRVQRIQGQATQHHIQIRLVPYLGEWGEKAVSGGQTLPTLEVGKTYELKAYETGGYIGVPARAYKEEGIEVQTTSYYFRTQLVVYKARVIAPLRISPTDSQGRKPTPPSR